MDKASERSLLQMLERLLASQEEMISEMKAKAAARQEEAVAHQDKSDAKIEARLNQFNEKIKARQEKVEAQADAHLERMEATMCSIPSDIDRILQQQIEAWKERYLSSEERTTICRVLPVACPDNSKGDVITFEQNSEEMDATRLEATPEETGADMITSEETSEEMEATPEESEAAVERQELFKEDTYFDNIGSSEDRYEDRRLVMRRRRGAKKRAQDSVGFR
jgi:hypothetical protein